MPKDVKEENMLKGDSNVTANKSWWKWRPTNSDCQAFSLYWMGVGQLPVY